MRQIFIAAVLLLIAVPVLADVIYSTNQAEFDSGVLNQGWWSSGPVHTTNLNTNDNHYTGILDGDTLRSFYTFNLTGLSGQVTAAKLRVMRGIQDASHMLTLWDVTSNAAAVNNNTGLNAGIFDDLGGGNSYGSYWVPTGDFSDYVEFALDAQAITDINAMAGGYFSIGANMDDRRGYMFSGTGSGGSSVDVSYLVLTTVGGESVADTPEPVGTVWVLFGMALLPIYLRSRRQA